jgi:hypothetical protein
MPARMSPGPEAERLWLESTTLCWPEALGASHHDAAARPAPTFRRSEDPEHLHPTIVGIGDPEPVAGVDVDARGQPELAGVTTLATERQEQPPRVVEHLDRLEVGVDHVEAVVRVEGDPLRLRKVPRAVAVRAHLAQRAPVAVEDLHAEVQRVGDVQPAGGVERHVRREVEPTGLDAARAETLAQPPLGVEDDHLVRGRVGDEEAAGDGVHRHAARTLEPPLADGAEPAPPGVERDDRAGHRVGDEQAPARIPRHAEGLGEGDGLALPRPPLVAAALQVEHVHALPVAVGDEDAVAAVGRDAVRRHHRALRVVAEQDRPERPSRLEVAVGGERADELDAGGIRRRRPAQRRLERLEHLAPGLAPDVGAGQHGGRGRHRDRARSPARTHAGSPR